MMSLKKANNIIIMKNIVMTFIISVIISSGTLAQDTTDILKMLEKEMTIEGRNQTEYVRSAFKSTRLINGHSVENTAKGIMDLRISHRFGTLNKGAYEFFGLDNATMRLGFDFGLTNNLMAGIGRSTFEKTFDAFFKLKILRQSTGKQQMPVTLSYVPTIALKTLKLDDPNKKKYFASRLFYTHQLIIARKFSERFSLQLMPSFIHRNLAATVSDPNDIYALGIGGRQKLTKRTSFNIEYYYQLPGHKLPGTTNALSVGFDIETGGHVFQLHFTNSEGMAERQFISETTGSWGDGDILFGFNISRIFALGKRNKN